jgi:4a-hydroxytetrahydrobiopterin dehydratase
MTRLADRRCAPLPDGTPALTADERASRLAELAAGWKIVEDKKLRRTFAFDDFATALAFVVEVGMMSDEQDHHPEITLSYGKVIVELWTHTVGGLSENDFIHAAKTDEILKHSEGFKAT